MFLLRMAFWLAIVILFIPAGKEASSVEEDGISIIETLSAARDVWHDVSTFCERNPETCETGSRLAADFGDKARNGAKLLYAYLDGQLGQDSSDDVVTGSMTR